MPRNPDAPRSPVSGVSWNSQLGKWHVRIRAYVDGKLKYASYGLYDDQADAERTAAAARAGELPPHTPGSAARARRQDIPRYVTRPGCARPDLTSVATCDLLTELKRRGALP